MLKYTQEEIRRSQQTTMIITDHLYTYHLYTQSQSSTLNSNNKKYDVGLANKFRGRIGMAYEPVTLDWSSVLAPWSRTVFAMSKCPFVTDSISAV